jgi:DNA-binding GntR family transcriptional regulator
VKRVTARVAEAAGTVLLMIADGQLKPGDRGPTGAALHELTGVSVYRCMLALHLLAEQGVLIRQAVRNGRAWIVTWVVAEPAQRM